jgi:DNA-binding transcriptional ArsR family regulator
MQVPGVEWLATDTQGDIIDELRQRSSATTREIAESVGCSKEHARDTLRRLYDRGIVDVHENAGDHGAHLYRVLAGIDGPTRPSEHVDLSPSRDDDADGNETANDAVWEYNTWSLVVSPVTPSGSVMIEGSPPDAPADLSQSSDAAAVDTGEPPG